jgi:hypothetical protein
LLTVTTQLLVSTRKGLFVYEREGARDWRVVHRHFLGSRVSNSLVDARDGAIYAALDHGHFGCKLHRSDDRGASFPEITAPAYPPKPDDYEDVDANGKVIPWRVELLWTLAAGGADEPDALWCGTIPGGLFRSGDRGESWQLVESLWSHPDRKHWFGGGYDLPGIHSICVDPRDSRRVFLGVSCGGVWQTRDRGETWTLCAKGMRATFMPPELQDDQRSQDPHRIVQCRAAPEHLWSQHHCGIYRSTDGSGSWTELTDVAPSSFGFAVAVHPSDPATAWFVPATSDGSRIPADGQVVVNRTRDGGASFETLRDGLPQQDAYDLFYRHALAVDSSGEILAMGSTTGGLWVSEDQGDSWFALAQHLPPIAAVELA